MKIYISADLEGIGGVVIKEQVTKGHSEYEEARRLLIREVNAAVDGAFEGGATEVLVKDAHGSGFNFPLEELHPRAEFIMGPSVPERFPFLEECDALFLVGYHAMAGTPFAVRDHTMSSVAWQRFTLNGREMGEVGIDAAYAGCFGVPVALVTGDDKVCAEARELLGEISTAVVKRALGRHSARLLPPSRSRELVREAARKAMEIVGTLQPLKIPPPYSVTLRYTGSELADARPVDGRSIIRVDGQTVEYRGEDLKEVLTRVLR